MNITKNEVILWGILFIVLLAIGVNFDDKIYNLFIGIIAGIMILKIIDYNQKTYFPIERVRNLKKTFMLTVIGLISTYAITLIIFGIDNAIFGSKFFGVQSITLQTIFSYFAQQNFIFSGSVFLTFVAIAGIVAISETWLVAVLMDLIRDIKRFKVYNYEFNNPRTYAAISLIVGFLVVLHFSAKGLGAAALVPVAVFFLVSCIIIKIEGQALAAILMHIINNSIALAITFALISSFTLTGPVVVTGVILLGIYFLFKTKLLIRPIGG